MIALALLAQLTLATAPGLVPGEGAVAVDPPTQAGYRVDGYRYHFRPPPHRVYASRWYGGVIRNTRKRIWRYEREPAR